MIVTDPSGESATGATAVGSPKTRATPAQWIEDASGSASSGAVTLASNCLFEEAWWLDAVAPGCWGEATVADGTMLQARITYGLQRTAGFTTLRQPPLTQTLGPWYRPTDGKYATRLAREKDLATELVARLPRHEFFSINFHRSVSNWLPFFWRGFEASPRITYVISDLGDEAKLWSDLQENARREIRKAQKQLTVETTVDVELFLELNRKTFARQGHTLPYDPSIVQRVDAACTARGARRIYIARDAQQRVHAAIYVVFDERCCYYLMGGGDPELRMSGAGSLLMWQAIQDARACSREFDFEGSMGESIERYFRGFGARQQTYLNVRRSGRWLGMAGGLRTAMQALRGR